MAVKGRTQSPVISPVINSIVGPSSIPVVLEGCVKIAAMALLDTGNRIAAGVAMNEELAKKLKVKIHPLDAAVGTAGDDEIKVVGEIRNLKVWIDRKCCLSIDRAWVIPQLSHELNLGSEWLGAQRAVVDYHSDPPRLRVGKREVQMVNSIAKTQPELGRTPDPAVRAQPVLDVTADGRNSGESLEVRGERLRDSGENLWELPLGQ